MNKLKTFALLFMSTLAFTSCDSLLDDSETDFGQGPVLAQFSNTTAEINIIKTTANEPIQYEIPITYFGGKNVALDRDVSVTIATSAKSVAKEGVEFEITNKTFTIPAGETEAKASITILTAGLVPFDFKDIILEITDSSEAVSDVNTFSLTLKALGADTLAGTYEVTDGQYWNSGSRRSDYTGRKYNIEAISPGLYRHVGIAFWVDGNEFYFTVDDKNGDITVLDKNPAGEETLLNGSPAMTCDNQYAFEMIPCVANSTLKPDGKHIVVLSVGYFRGTGSTREFTQTMVRIP